MKQMRDRMIEILKKFCTDDCKITHQCGYCDFGDLTVCPSAVAEHLIANGVIVPPCKVGDTVYRVSFVHKKVDVLKVDGFLANVASWKVHCTHIVPSWIGNQKEHVYIAFSSFGKTVFLALKEAEQAIKGAQHEE